MELTLHSVDETEAVKALAALSQVQRLRAFRALIAAGPVGTTPGVLSGQLGIGGSALSFHLKELTHAGLVSSEPRGRNLVYRANFERMNGLLAYLTEHCCQGRACDLNEPAGRGAC
jgi:DNA-binding transcriptional ArsR family regulator